MSNVVIFDTSVLVDEARTGRHRKRIESVEGVVRLSSVVLGELLRGVSGPPELKFLRNLARNHPVLTPTQNWLDSGEILAKIRADQGFEPHKLRDLHFDVLISHRSFERCTAYHYQSERFRADQSILPGQP